MDLWVRDDAKLVHMVHDVMYFGSHKRVDKFRCAHGHAHACHCSDIDNVQLRFSKIHVIEFTETLKRRVLCPD
jgi:hypothetical protein